MNDQLKEVFDKVSQLVNNKFNDNYPRAFDFYDQDKNGKLGPKDLRKLLEEAGVGNWLTRGVWVAGVIHALDLDGDGAVSIPELTVAFMKGMG